jgi:hypothetical protein
MRVIQTQNYRCKTKHHISQHIVVDFSDGLQVPKSARREMASSCVEAKPTRNHQAIIKQAIVKQAIVK